MTTRRRFLAAATALGAVAATRTRPAAAADPKPLTIGYVPSTLFAPVFVAVDRGYLSDRGFAPSMTPIVAGQDAVALLAQGQLDVVAGGLSAAFFNGVARGFDVRLVGSTGYQPRKGIRARSSCARTSGRRGLRSVKDLRGKKVAWIGGNGAVSTYYVARILRPAGLTLADIEVVNLSNPDQGVAFERKAIDAAFTPAPFTTAFQDRKLAHPLAWPPAGISGTGIFFGSTLLGSPDIAARALAAFRQASAEVAGKAYDSAANMASYAKYTQQTVATLEAQDRYDFDPKLRIDVATLDDMQELFISLGGVVTYKTPLPNDKLIASP